MKKYISGLLAIVLAIMLCAAQTISETISHKKEMDTSGKMLFYWYRTNSIGVITDESAMMFGGQPKTWLYAEENDGCNGSVFDCLRGFEDPIPSYWFPTSMAGEITTKRDF